MPALSVIILFVKERNPNLNTLSMSMLGPFVSVLDT